MDKNPETNTEAILIRKHIDQMGEHFDSVQVFASKQVNAVTEHYSIGTGNWFSRYGQVREWLILEEEKTKIEARKATDG